jgi:hypothetical protein
LANGAQDGWPSKCESATKIWPLAKWLRRMFGVPLLQQCAGLNAIFVRAPKVEIYRKTVARQSREKIANFCLPLAERLIAVMQPRRIVSIGFETLDLFGGGSPDVKNDKGRILTRVGTIAGRSAIGTLHLSGAQMSNIDRARMPARILAA